MTQIEPDWIHQFFKLAEKIETSETALLQLDNVLTKFSGVIQGALPFEFIAIQLFNKEDRTIQTVHATGSQEHLVGLAKHPVDGDDEFLDIQASVFIADPPKLKLISGWDSHFDKLIYDQFDHASLVRVWSPIIVLKNANGNIISDWMHLNTWREAIINDEYTQKLNGQEIERFNIDIVLDRATIERKYGQIIIERIGAVEAGHHVLKDGITRKTAVSLANMVAQLAISSTNAPLPAVTADLPSLREASLDYVLEKTAESAMRILRGTAATLHFCQDEVRDRYVYEVSSGRTGPDFLASHPPRKNGLGHLALQEKRPVVAPDLAANQAINGLQTVNPAAWALGIRMMAAFPLILSDTYGVLYIGFDYCRRLSEYDYYVIDRFLSLAAKGIRTSTYHKDTLDDNRRLTNFNLIAQSLVSQRPEHPLPEQIAGYTLNLLAADFVTIHEYIASNGTFSDAAIAGHYRSEVGEPIIAFKAL